jgi:hypothetical protein
VATIAFSGEKVLSLGYMRVADAIHHGYLRNLEDRKGRPARLKVGDPFAEALEVLPDAEALQRCRRNGGMDTPTQVSSFVSDDESAEHTDDQHTEVETGLL